MTKNHGTSRRSRPEFLEGLKRDIEKIAPDRLGGSPDFRKKMLLSATWMMDSIAAMQAGAPSTPELESLEAELRAKGVDPAALRREREQLLAEALELLGVRR